MSAPWLRRAGKALALLGGGGVLLLVGGALFLTTDAGNRLIRAQLVRLAGPLVPGGSIELDDLRFNLRSELELRGLRLKDAEGAPILSVGHLDLRYSLADILDRRLVVRQLTIEDPTIRLETAENGQLNALIALGIEPSPPSTEPARAWEGLGGVLEVEALHISGLNLRYLDGDTELSLSQLGLDAGVTLDQGDVRLRGLAVRAQLDAPGDLPLSVDGDLSLVADTLSLDRLDLGLGETRAALRGSIANAQTAPALDLALEARARPGDVAALAGDFVIRQDLTARLDVDGPLSALELHGDLEADAGRMAVQGLLNLEADPLAWELLLATDGFDLHALVDAVTEETHLAGRYAVKGTGTAWPDAPGLTDPALIQASVRIDGEDQVLWGEPLRGLTLEASIERGRVAVKRLSGRLAVGVANLSGLVDVPAGTADLSGQVNIGDLAKLSRYGVEGLGGSAAWSGAVSVGWSEPELRVDADGTLSGRGLAAPGGVSIGELSAPLDVAVRGEAVSGDGELAMTGLSAPGVTLERGAARWTLERRADGALTAAVRDLDLEGLRAPDADVSMARATGGADLTLSAAGRPGGALSLELVELALPTGVTASGPVTGALVGDALQATVDLRAGERPVLTGDARGDLAGGAWAIDGLALGLTGDALWVAQQPVTFTLVDGGARALALDLSSEVGRLSASGDASPRAADVALHLSELDLAWVSALARRFDASDPLAGLEGALSLDAELRGERDAGTTGEARATLTDLMMPGAVDARVDLTLDLRATEGALRFEGALDREGARWLSLGGDVPLDLALVKGEAAPRCGEDLAARAIVGPLKGADLAEVVPAAKDAFQQLSADLTLGGDVCDPDIGLTLATTAMLEATERLARVDLKLSRGAGDLAVRGGLSLEGARRVQLDGHAKTALSEVMAWVFQGAPEPELAAPETWLSELELNAVPLAVPLELLGAPTSMTGSLAGGLQVSGPLRDLKLAGGLQWMNGTLGSVALNLGYLGLEPAEGGYELTALLGFPEGGGLELTGFVPMRIDLAGDLGRGVDEAMADNRLMLNISDGQGGPARLPLEALFSGVSGFSEAAGSLELSGTVGGSLGSLAPDLQLGLYGGAVTMASTAVRYQDINLNAEIRADHVRLRDLAVTTRPRYGPVLRPGKLSGTGEVALAGFDPRGVSLDLDMSDFWVSATQDLNLAVSGALHATGSWPALTLGGDLALGQARISRSRDSFLDNASFSLNPDIRVWRGGALSAPSSGEVPGVWEDFALNLKVDLNRNLTLHVEMPTSTDYGKQFADLSSVTLDAELDGELSVSGTAGAPSLVGVIETVRGEMLLLGADFALAPEGQISFAGGEYDNPILNLEAVRSTDGYGDVHAIITQHVADLKVDFRADDYPDPADAMALILFGRPSSELTDSEGGSASALASMALASLSGEIERAVGVSAVDQFEIDPTSNAVRVGKALADNLFLSLQLQTGADSSENTAQATVEWMIRRKLYAEFVTGDAGKSSADLYWRWRF